MDNQNNSKSRLNFPPQSLFLVFAVATITFVSGFAIGQKSTNLSAVSKAQNLRLQLATPPESKIPEPFNPPNILSSVTGNITNIIPGLDGNIVIEVTGISIRDIMTSFLAGKEVKSKNRNYTFLVTSKSQIFSLTPPVPDVPIGDLINNKLPQPSPSSNLSLRDLKNGLLVTVYAGPNQKIAEKIEVMNLSTPSSNPTPTGINCSPLPDTCNKTTYPDCIANMGIPPGGWCPLNSNTSSSTSYVACGCGCCGSTTPNKVCLYQSRGDNLDTIIQQDKKAKQDSQCATAGCSIGTEYTYCD